jgi:hypothetical protein
LPDSSIARSNIAVTANRPFVVNRIAFFLNEVEK